MDKIGMTQSERDLVDKEDLLNAQLEQLFADLRTANAMRESVRAKIVELKRQRTHLARERQLERVRAGFSGLSADAGVAVASASATDSKVS